MVRLQALLGDLTQLYDQVLGTLELERKSLDPGAWLLDILKPWRAAAHEKGVQMAIEINPSMPDISFDPLRLSQAVGNLLSNAIKFTPQGGKVQIKALVEGLDLLIMVSDNGPGIPPEELENIFLPFFRGHQGKRFVEGMGLGLSIAREFVRAHGGDITGGQ